MSTIKIGDFKSFLLERKDWVDDHILNEELHFVNGELCCRFNGIDCDECIFNEPRTCIITRLHTSNKKEMNIIMREIYAEEFI